MNLSLDIGTLLVTAGLLQICATIALAEVWYVHRDEPSTRYWVLAFVLTAVGVFAIAFREQIPMAVSVILGNMGLMLGGVALCKGAAVFLHREISLIPLLALQVAAFAGLLYWLFVEPSLTNRNMCYSIGHGMAYLTSGWILVRAVGQEHLICRYMGAVQLFSALLLFIRGYSMLGLTGSIDEIREGSQLFMAWLMWAPAQTILISFGCMLMIVSRVQARLDSFAHQDALTGLLNRRAFYQQIRTKPCQGGILVLDLDNFKRLNDDHGHAAGDWALIHFVQVVRGLLREQDVFARSGGEEFWIFLPGMAATQVMEVAENLRITVAEQVATHSGRRHYLTVSIGVAMYDPVRDASIESVISRADKAMYRAKTQGRNRVGTLFAATEAEAV